MFLSVIIPLYNKRHTINKCLDSIYYQDFNDYEIIIVDDGSTDCSVDVIDCTKGNVKILKKENGGPSSARNVGIQYASGDWLVFMDADDVFIPGAFATIKNTITNLQIHIPCFVFNFYVEDIQGNRKLYSTRFKNGFVRNNFCSLANDELFLRAGTTVYSKSIAQQYLFNENLRRYEDLEQTFRILDKEKLFSSNKPVMIYRKGEACASKKRENIAEDFEGHLSLSPNFWKNICICRLYFEAKKLYPEDCRRLYKNIRSRFLLLLCVRIVNIKKKLYTAFL